MRTQFAAGQVIPIGGRGSVWCLLFGIVLAVRETILNMFGEKNEKVRSGRARFDDDADDEEGDNKLWQAREERTSSMGKSASPTTSKQGEEVEVIGIEAWQ